MKPVLTILWGFSKGADGVSKLLGRLAPTKIETQYNKGFRSVKEIYGA